MSECRLFLVTAMRFIGSVRSRPANLARMIRVVAASAQQYARVVAEEEFAAWMATLKEKYPVTINKAALESKER
jgi:hypothetical protein